jgi:hypothetical protein
MAMMQSQRDSAFFLKWFDRKECLFFGTHVDDKLGATSDAKRLFTKWFVLEMNKKFILNPEPINNFDFTAGVGFHYDKAKRVRSYSTTRAPSTSSSPTTTSRHLHRRNFRARRSYTNE